MQKSKNSFLGNSNVIKRQLDFKTTNANNKRINNNDNVSKENSSFQRSLAMLPKLEEDLQTLQVYRERQHRLDEAKKSFIIDTFERRVREIPQKTMVIYEDNFYSFELINKMACKVAAVGRSWGLKCKDCVALMMFNEPAFVWTFLGLQKLGVTVALVNYNLRSHSLVHCVLAVQPKAFIIGADEGILSAVSEDSAEFRKNAIPVWAQGICSDPPPPGVLCMDGLMARAVPSEQSPKCREGLTMLDTCCYIYTSGTTGTPKAAHITYTRASGTSVTLGFVQFGPEDRVYTALPLYHTVGIGFGMFGAIWRGATVVLRKKFSATHFWEDCRRYDVTVIQYIGEMLRYLLAQPQSALDKVHKVRAAYGNGLRKDVWLPFKERFGVSKIVEFFGSTEGTGVFVNVTEKPGAIGRWSPLLRQYFKDKALVKFDFDSAKPIRDKNGRCIEVGPGEPGLCLSMVPEAILNPDGSYNVYLGGKELSESKLVRNVLRDGDVFFNFGDAMYLDKDYYVYFHDRLGETFRWKGENVSTTEVASVIVTLPFIQDAHVYGVHVPGHDGKAGMAAVTLNTGNKLDTPTLKTLYDHVCNELPAYAKPLFIRLLEEHDVTGTYKVVKRDLMKDGYDLNMVHDPIFFFNNLQETYTRLTKSNLPQLLSAKL